MANEDLKLQELLYNDWKIILKSTLVSKDFHAFAENITSIYQSEIIYPPQAYVFHALNLCEYKQTRVVIIGQDPYHGLGQAHGLSFSVPNGVALPPSLKNIFKELNNDLGVIRSSGDLSDWAQQGVLLLNSALTVRAGEAGSHQKLGWSIFTNAVLKALNDHEKPLVFLLWGNFAQKFAASIDETKHAVIKSAHPSPLSANRGAWFGSKPFSQTNDFLLSRGLDPIQWV
jgi:uracil-DNA glycosylase